MLYYAVKVNTRQSVHCGLTPTRERPHCHHRQHRQHKPFYRVDRTESERTIAGLTSYFCSF